MKHLPIIALILSIISLGFSVQRSLTLGSTVTSTASSDTLETFRVNVNASLGSLQNDKVSTTTAYTWTALQKFYGLASTTSFSANFIQVGGSATTTITTSGTIGVSSSTPIGSLSVEQGTETSSLWIGNNGSSTPSLMARGVNGNGNIGIASSSPFTTLGIGTTGATSTISGGFFCAYFKDEAGRGMFIKLATSGNVVLSTSTSPCM